MKKLSEYLFLWTFGGCLYYSFEVIFHGFSHWSMFILGNLLCVFCDPGKDGALAGRCVGATFRCIVFVTAMEFITGIIVNKWLGLAVWDYSDQPFQLFGQICLPFMVIFSGLCVLGILLSGYLTHWLYGDEKPHYHVL